MSQFILKLNNIHYDAFSNEAFEFNLSITCEFIKECDKNVLKKIAEHQIISYMIATGKNFLRDHTDLLEYLNNYTLHKFIKVTKIGKSIVTAYPIEIEKTEQIIKITKHNNILNSVTTK